MGNQNIKQNDIAANKDIKKNSRHFIMGKQSHGEIKDHFYLLFSTTAYVCVCADLVAQSRLTLCNPLSCSPPGSFVHGIFQARILEWVAIPSSRVFFQHSDRNLHLLCLLHCRQILYPLSHRDYSLQSHKSTLVFLNQSLKVLVLMGI